MKMEKDTNIMQGKGEWDESEHPRDEEGKFAEKSSVKNELTKSGKSGIVMLDSEEYAKFCHAIRTKHADKIPKKGHIFLDNHFCLFRYNRRTERLVCTLHIPIEGNRELINLYTGGQNGKNN